MAVTKEELGKVQQVYNQLKTMREPYTKIWRKVARWVDPWYGDMDMEADPTPNPLPTKTDLFDSTVGYYSQVFATGLQGYTCSSQSAFFELTPERTDGSDDNSLVEVLQARTRKMYKVFAGSGFYSALHMFFKSFGDLGTGIMLFGVNQDQKIYYEYVPNYLCLLMKDSTRGICDTLFRTFWLTKYEAIRMYGEENLPSEIRNNKTDPVKRYRFIQLICPRDRFELSVDNEFRYIELVWYANDTEKAVFEGGSDFLRFAACPFSEGMDGTGWGTGAPGMRQFSSSHSLNNMLRDQMNASQLLASPTIKKTEGVHAEIKPGGFINVPVGGDIAPLQLGQDLSWTNVTRQDIRQIAKADYFVDFFLMLSQYSGNVNTATLAQGLQNEQLKMMTFFLDTLKNRFFEPVIDWTWNTMGALGMFNDQYDIDFKTLQVDYVSPLYRLQRQAVTLEPTLMAMNSILPYVQIDQSLMSYIDFGGYVEAVREGTNADARVIRNKKEALAMMQQQIRMQQEAQKAQQAIAQQDADTRSYEATLKAPEEGSVARKAAANDYSGLTLY